jgi:pimeloyl-ACP methyl ester carboxylesterase
MAVPADEGAPTFRRLAIEFPSVIRLFLDQLRPAVISEPIGKGRPVLVLPGFLTGDMSTALLRRSLHACGFCPFGWGMGLNRGARVDTLKRLEKRLDQVIAAAGKPVLLLGWSLGGLFARELAKQRPGDVGAVITLGSPFSGDLRANNAWRLYELINGHKVDEAPIGGILREKPPVQTIAVWSPVDGIVAPASARGKEDEADRRVELRSTHMGMGSRPRAVRYIIRLCADVDAQG